VFNGTALNVVVSPLADAVSSAVPIFHAAGSLTLGRMMTRREEIAAGYRTTAFHLQIQHFLCHHDTTSLASNGREILEIDIERCDAIGDINVKREHIDGIAASTGLSRQPPE